MSNFHKDILKFPFISRLIRSPLFPFTFQILTLTIFIIILINGFNTPFVDKEVSVFLKKTNITTLLIWRFWLPGLLVVTFFFGRLWCAVCPMEFLNNLSYQVRKRIGFKGINLPNWIRGGWLILLFYLILQFSVAILLINKIPFYTSSIFTVFLLIAVISGLIFNLPRSFCYGFCPARLLLKNYSRITPLQLSHISSDTCAKCGRKECANPKYIDRWNNRSCPSLLKPYERWAGDDCVLCFQCVKICPYNNLGFGVVRRKRGARIVKPLMFTAALYVVVESGFVLYEIFEEVGWFEHIFFTIPRRIAFFLNVPQMLSYLETGWFLLVFPFVFFVMLWAISYLNRSKADLLKFIRRTALIFIPVVGAAHTSKALMEMNGSAPLFLRALRDPKGLSLALALASGKITPQSGLFPSIPIVIMAGFLVVFSPFIALSYFEKEVIPNTRLAAYLGIFFICILYLVGIIASL